MEEKLVEIYLRGIERDLYEITTYGLNENITATFSWNTAIDTSRSLFAHALRLAGGKEELNETRQEFLREIQEKLGQVLVSNDLKHAAQLQNSLLTICLRIDFDTAQELESFPWELAKFDGVELSRMPTTSILRLPAKFNRQSLDPISDRLRVLVVVSAPHDLPDEMVLNYSDEIDRLLRVFDRFDRQEQIQVDFTEDGSLETIESYLELRDYHVIHFVGHGDAQHLFLVNPKGELERVKNARFAEMVTRRSPSVRMVFLSACDTGTIYPGDQFSLAQLLIAGGCPTVIAMQGAIREDRAAIFAEEFYYQIVRGSSIGQAASSARYELYQTSLRDDAHLADFAIPVIYTADPYCLNVRPQTVSEEHALGFFGATIERLPPNRFYGRTLELNHLKWGFESAHWKAAIIYGLGGLGKTQLAVRYATSQTETLGSVFARRMDFSVSFSSLFDEIKNFLAHQGINISSLVRSRTYNLLQDVTILTELITQSRLRLLFIFDNMEDMLVRGLQVSRSSSGDALVEERETNLEFLDLEMKNFFEQFIQGLPSNGYCKVIFTSRVRFGFANNPELEKYIGYASLSEMSFPVAKQIMDHIEVIRTLPISSPMPDDLSKRRVYEIIGGHPFSLHLLSKWANNVSSDDKLFGEISKMLKAEVVDFALMSKAINNLSEPSRKALAHCSIIRTPITVDLVRAISRGTRKLDDLSLTNLINEWDSWGLASRVVENGQKLYVLHSIVKEWCLDHWNRKKYEGVKSVHERASDYYFSQAAHNPMNLVLAYYHAKEGKDENSAFALVFSIATNFTGLGLSTVVESIIRDALRYCEIPRLRCNMYTFLGMNLARQGKHLEARQYFKRQLDEECARDSREFEAEILHNYSVEAEALGQHEEAREAALKSFEIRRDLHAPDIGASYGRLASIYLRQGNTPEAERLLRQSIEVYDQQIANLQSEIQSAINRDALGTMRFSLNDAKNHAINGRINLANILSGSQRHDEAEVLLQRAERMAVESHNVFMQRLIVYHKAKLAFQRALNLSNPQMNLDNAVDLVRRSIKMAEDQHEPVGVVEGYLLLGKIEQARNNHQGALEAFATTVHLCAQNEAQEHIETVALHHLCHLRRRIDPDVFKVILLSKGIDPANINCREYENLRFREI